VDLVLHDARSGPAARFAAEHGGRAAADLAALARASAVVITMLPNGMWCARSCSGPRRGRALSRAWRQARSWSTWARSIRGFTPSWVDHTALARWLEERVGTRLGVPSGS